jgi:hypothetical protein
MRSHGLWWGSLVLAVALALIGLGLQSVIPVDRDAAFMVYNASKILSGEPLIRHFAPTAFNTVVFVGMASNYLLYLPAALLSVVTGLALSAAVKVEVAVLIAVSGLALIRFCRRFRQTWPAAPVLLPVMAFMVVVFPTDMYAQREHMFVLLLLPYILHRMAEAALMPATLLPRWLRFGLLAMALLIKPYLVGVWGLVEARRVLAARSLRPVLTAETAGLVLLNVAFYLTLIMILVRVYAITGEDFALAGHINALFMRQSLGDLVVRKYSLLWLLAFVALGVAWRHVSGLAAALVGILAVIGGLASALVQQKGADYHWYPAIAMAALTLAWLSATSAGWRRMALAALLAAQLGLAATRSSFYGERLWASRLNVDSVSDRAQALAAGGRVAILSLNHFPAYPILAQSGLRNAVRFQTFGFAAYLTPELQRGVIPGVAAALAEDLSAPDIGVVLIADELSSAPVTAAMLERPEIQEVLGRFDPVGPELGGFRFLVRGGRPLR